MRRYELMLLFRPDLEDDKLQSAVEKVTRAIVNAGGALTKVSPWGKRRLAYEIQHFREASYFLLHFDIAPAQIREIERGLLISEEILRHLVVVLEDRGELSEEDLPPAAAPRGEEPDDEGGEQAEGAEGDGKPDEKAEQAEQAEQAEPESEEKAEEKAEPASDEKADDGEGEGEADETASSDDESEGDEKDEA